jgi:energy-coupling factor transport system permease protein
MTLAVDLYSPGESWLHRLDPRTKLAMAAAGVTILLAMQSLFWIAAATVLVHAILLSARIPWERLRALWVLSAPTMILIVVLGTLLNPQHGPALLEIWGWSLSLGALAEASATALRIIALALAMAIWLYPTDQSSLVRGLVALGLPYPFGLALAMALRFVPAIAASFRTISDAQQARGLDLSKGGLVKRARAYVPIGVAVIITSLRAAENLSRALSSRAFASDTHRTELSPLSFSRLDAMIAMGTILSATLFLWLRWAYGVGTHPLGF